MLFLLLLAATRISRDFPAPMDVYDSLEVLETFKAPPRARDIREAYRLHEALPDARLNDNQYPSRLNPRNVDQGLENSLLKEFDAAAAKCWKNNVADEDIYWHYAGAAQYNGKTEDIEKADRVKVKYILDTRYGYHHSSGLYIPPGELVTIQVPESVGGVIKFEYNKQVADYVHHGSATSGTQTRLPKY